MKVIHTKFGYRWVAKVLGGCGMLALCALGVLEVLGGGNAYATNMDFSINVRPSASITVPSNPVNLSINPGSSAFSSATLNIEAGTSYDNGYTIIMQSGHNASEISNYNLVNTTDSSSVIPMLTTTYTEANFPANYWGVKVGSGNYGGIGTNGAITSTNTKGGSTVPVTLAAKVDYTKPAGDYTTTLNFSIVANVDSSASITNFTYMQDIANLSSTERQAVVDGMVESKTYTLKDSRDNQDYTIAKLKDGKVWMTKNLNLAGGTTLTSDNTDMPANYTLPTANGFQSGNKLPASEAISSGTTLDNSDAFSDNNIAYVFNSSSTTCKADTPCYSYYSWVAATLGSGVSLSTANSDAPYSICPAGWRLPTTRVSNSFDASLAAESDFYNLAVAYGMDSGVWGQSEDAPDFNIQAGAGTTANFVLAGRFAPEGIFGNSGHAGLYVTSTSGYNTETAYYLLFTSNRINSGINHWRSVGFSARCVLDTDAPTIDDLATMQDFASLDTYDKQSVVNSMAMETNYTLKDSRDDQDYTIAKLKDGKVWMTKNLNLAGGTTLTSTNTDMPDGYTLPTTNGFQAGNKLPASAIKNSGDNNLTDSAQFSDDNTAYVFNSGITANCGGSGQNIPCYSYYSWTATTLGSGVGISVDGENVTASICPKGWRLPTATQSGVGYVAGDFYKMILSYMGAGVTSLNQSFYDNTNPSPFFTNAGPATTVPGFLAVGYYHSGQFSAGGSGIIYWSSTSGSSINNAYHLDAYSYYVNSAFYAWRYNGLPARCMLAE